MQQTALLKGRDKCALIYCDKRHQDNMVKAVEQIENLRNAGLAEVLTHAETLKEKCKVLIVLPRGMFDQINSLLSL